MFNISKILDNNKFLVLSVVGDHADETLSGILDRKQEEIDKTGQSFWLINSSKARTEHIRKIGNAAIGIQQEIYCLFISAAQKNGAKPTKIISEAKQYSKDKYQRIDIPKGIKVTGMINAHTTGLVLNTLDIVENTEIDLWQYSDFFDNSKPVQTRLGASTVCVVKAYNQGMISRKRKVIGVGRLMAPYAMYLK